MDLVSLLAIVAIIFGIYVVPSSFIHKVEGKVHSMLSSTNKQDATVIDIGKIKKEVNKVKV